MCSFNHLVIFFYLLNLILGETLTVDLVLSAISDIDDTLHTSCIDGHMLLLTVTEEVWVTFDPGRLIHCYCQSDQVPTH